METNGMESLSDFTHSISFKSLPPSPTVLPVSCAESSNLGGVSRFDLQFWCFSGFCDVESDSESWSRSFWWNLGLLFDVRYVDAGLFSMNSSATEWALIFSPCSRFFYYSFIDAVLWILQRSGLFCHIALCTLGWCGSTSPNWIGWVRTESSLNCGVFWSRSLYWNNLQFLSVCLYNPVWQGRNSTKTL